MNLKVFAKSTERHGATARIKTNSLPVTDTVIACILTVVVCMQQGSTYGKIM